jgi:hypothetical protein
MYRKHIQTVENSTMLANNQPNSQNLMKRTTSSTNALWEFRKTAESVAGSSFTPGHVTILIL